MAKRDVRSTFDVLTKCISTILFETTKIKQLLFGRDGKRAFRSNSRGRGSASDRPRYFRPRLQAAFAPVTQPEKYLPPALCCWPDLRSEAIRSHFGLGIRASHP